MEFRMTGSRSGNDLTPDRLRLGTETYHFDNRPIPDAEQLARLGESEQNYWRFEKRIQYSAKGEEKGKSFQLRVFSPKQRRLVFLKASADKGTFRSWDLGGRAHLAKVTCTQDG